MTINRWSGLIAGIAALAVGTVVAATVEHARIRGAHAVAISLIPACTTNYGLTLDAQGRSVSVITLTCPEPEVPRDAAL